jgi:hypothetical protein
VKRFLPSVRGWVLLGLSVPFVVLLSVLSVSTGVGKSVVDGLGAAMGSAAMVVLLPASAWVLLVALTEGQRPGARLILATFGGLLLAAATIAFEIGMDVSSASKGKGLYGGGILCCAPFDVFYLVILGVFLIRLPSDLAAAARSDGIAGLRARLAEVGRVDLPAAAFVLGVDVAVLRGWVDHGLRSRSLAAVFDPESGQLISRAGFDRIGQEFLDQLNRTGCLGVAAAMREYELSDTLLRKLVDQMRAAGRFKGNADWAGGWLYADADGGREAASKCSACGAPGRVVVGRPNPCAHCGQPMAPVAGLAVDPRA